MCASHNQVIELMFYKDLFPSLITVQHSI